MRANSGLELPLRQSSADPFRLDQIPDLERQSVHVCICCTVVQKAEHLSHELATTAVSANLPAERLQARAVRNDDVKTRPVTSLFDAPDSRHDPEPGKQRRDSVGELATRRRVVDLGGGLATRHRHASIGGPKVPQEQGYLTVTCRIDDLRDALLVGSKVFDTQLPEPDVQGIMTPMRAAIGCRKVTMPPRLLLNSARRYSEFGCRGVLDKCQVSLIV